MREVYVGVVSSRYAFHGAGFNYQNLPEEKLNFAELYTRLKALGAKKFYFVGLSQEGFSQLVTLSTSTVEQMKATEDPGGLDLVLEPAKITAVREQLKDANALPNEDIFTKYGDDKTFQLSQIQKFKSAASQEAAFAKLARIDALFAEF